MLSDCVRVAHVVMVVEMHEEIVPLEERDTTGDSVRDEEAHFDTVLDTDGVRDVLGEVDMVIVTLDETHDELVCDGAEDTDAHGDTVGDREVERVMLPQPDALFERDMVGERVGDPVPHVDCDGVSEAVEETVSLKDPHDVMLDEPCCDSVTDAVTQTEVEAEGARENDTLGQPETEGLAEELIDWLMEPV